MLAQPPHVREEQDTEELLALQARVKELERELEASQRSAGRVQELEGALEQARRNNERLLKFRPNDGDAASDSRGGSGSATWQNRMDRIETTLSEVGFLAAAHRLSRVLVEVDPDPGVTEPVQSVAFLQCDVVNPNVYFSENLTCAYDLKALLHHALHMQHLLMGMRSWFSLSQRGAPTSSLRKVQRGGITAAATAAAAVAGAPWGGISPHGVYGMAPGMMGMGHAMGLGICAAIHTARLLAATTRIELL
eukprot:gene17916-21333_t